MKIGIIFENEPTDGGAFTQSIASIKQFILANNNYFEIQIFTFEKKGCEYLQNIDLDVKFLKFSWFERLIKFVATKINLFSNRNVMPSFLENKLLKYDVNIVYFLSPSYRVFELKNLNYISTIFDLCHLDYPEFPEIRSTDEIFYREKLFKYTLSRSLLIVVNDDVLKHRITCLYGINENRIYSIPFDLFKDDDFEIISLDSSYLPERYIFYPAQFWPHKNHRRIIESIKILQNNSINISAIFVGSDKGNNLITLKNYARELGIEDLIIFKGFVPEEELILLYKRALTLIMPSYFGPTNLPPLEAWIYGCPVIYNKYFISQTGNAALYVDPDDVSTFIDPIKQLIDSNIADSLIINGKNQLLKIRQKREAEIGNMIIELIKISRRIHS